MMSEKARQPRKAEEGYPMLGRLVIRQGPGVLKIEGSGAGVLLPPDATCVPRAGARRLPREPRAVEAERSRDE